MLAVQGRVNDAADQYRRAIALRDDNAQAHNNLARLLSGQKQYAEAVDQFTRSLALQPDSIASLGGLAWIRATVPDPAIRNPAEAVQLAERAATLTGRRDASVLDTLAAAYAANGQFDRAVETARTAMQLADTSGANALWVEIRARVQLYERQTPFLIR
jgi:tetratricopeptide (TPR) repeat protein